MLQLIIVCTCWRLQQKKAHLRQTDTTTLYDTHTQQQQHASVNVIWFPLDPHTAWQLLFFRGKFQVSLCVHEVIPQSQLVL
jgi:hypothetical protein